ncbi:hypothetical protein CBR_g48132 [Chara braunii]|uniref:Manganese-dependent ADP-ribose/CDP-alcohol diphosphatase n=1 Tax=Chara braunii TaxID=69332 RepID=A0A388M295_CHABU|nr:hypothetical protein CBR_g48132 [Chara braunii]|eukprot:GBG88602.1 hypothetical protein CBR_g48132 [Chara braunii]
MSATLLSMLNGGRVSLIDCGNILDGGGIGTVGVSGDQRKVTLGMTPVTTVSSSAALAADDDAAVSSSEIGSSPADASSYSLLGVPTKCNQTASNSDADFNKKKPIFSFGVVTDVQYADIEDGRSFSGVPRYYRHSLTALGRAIQNWNELGYLSFAVHFGDIVDGFCPRKESSAAVDKVVRTFNRFRSGPVYHMIGNHCLYNLPRASLNEILQIPTAPDCRSYYSFTPCKGFRFVVLDGYDISLLGWPEDHPHAVEAALVLDKGNPNENKNSPEGLRGLERRFVKFGGGISTTQLEWLDNILKEAEAEEEKVIIGCHLPMDPRSTDPICLLWNYDEVLRVLHNHSCVVATFAGHAHTGGYAVDKHGIHHRVLEAVLECPPGSDAYGHVDVFEDRLVLTGTGALVSSVMHFTGQQKATMRDES